MPARQGFRRTALAPGRNKTWTSDPLVKPYLSIHTDRPCKIEKIRANIGRVLLRWAWHATIYSDQKYCLLQANVPVKGDGSSTDVSMQDGGPTDEQSKQKPAILAGTGTLQSVPFMERPAPPARPMTKLKPQKVVTARQPSAGNVYVYCVVILLKMHVTNLKSGFWGTSNLISSMIW